MRRRTFLSAAILVLGCSNSSSPPPATASTEATGVVAKLNLASGTWSPFTDVPGKPRIAIDLVHEALRRAGVEVETTIVHPQELMPKIEAGTFAGSEALWHTEERAKTLLYSEPYLENRLILLGRKGKEMGAQSLSELAGKSLGIVKGYAYGPDILASTGPRLVEGLSDEDNLRSLLKGELDFILVDELLVYYLFEYSKEEAKKQLAFGTQALATASLHFAVRRDHPDAASIVERFNQQIEGMTRDGTYHQVLKVSWLIADVDGDGRDEAVFKGSFAGQDPPEVQYRLSGAKATGSPRFMVEGEVYGDWEQVPPRYKTTTDVPEDRFKPGINAVLFEF